MNRYEFRLEFRFSSGDCIQCDADSLEILAVEDVRLRLKTGAHGTPIKTNSRVSIIGGPYSTQEQAWEAAVRARTAVLAWAVNERFGVDFGGGRPPFFFTEYGLRLLETELNCPVRPAIHGIDVFEPRENLRFVRLDLNAGVGKSAENFVNRFRDSFLAHSRLSEKVELACELYCQSYFDVSLRSRFITLVTAIEALIDPPARSTAAVELVTVMQRSVDESLLPKPTKESLRGALQFLKLESISQTGKALAAKCLPGRQYLGRESSQFFSYCYSIRSQIVHNGRPSDTSIDLWQLATECQAFVGDLLNAILPATPSLSVEQLTSPGTE